MKPSKSLPFLTAALLAGQVYGQALPTKPEDNGVSPVGETVYVNTSDILNNGKASVWPLAGMATSLSGGRMTVPI